MLVTVHNFYFNIKRDEQLVVTIRVPKQILIYIFWDT